MTKQHIALLLFRWSSAVMLKECINSYYFQKKLFADQKSRAA